MVITIILILWRKKLRLREIKQKRSETSIFEYSHLALEPKVFHLRVLLGLSRCCMQSGEYSGFSCSFSLNSDISLSYRINLIFSLAHNPSKGLEVLNINIGLFLLPGVWASSWKLRMK